MSIAESPEGISIETRNELPDLIEIHSQEFRAWYESILSLHLDIFGDDKLPSFDQLVQEFEKADILDQNFLRELATFMTIDLPMAKGMLNGDIPWDHQMVYIAQYARAMLEKNVNGVLLPAAAGVGKARIMGWVILIMARLMQRGLFDKNILTLVKGRALTLQQGIGPAAMQGQVLNTQNKIIRNRELNEQYNFIDDETMLAHTKFFTMGSWKELAHKNPKSHLVAKNMLIKSMEERGVFETFQLFPHHEELINNYAKMLCREAVIIDGPHESDKELLDISANNTENDAASDFYFGLPEELKNVLYIRSSFLLEEDSLSIPEETRFAMLPIKSLTLDSAIVKIRGFLKNVGLIITDEAMCMPQQSLERFVTDKKVGGEKPRILAATAYDRRGLLYFNRKLSVLDTKNAVERGVLEPQRMVEFPAAGEPLFTSGTYEAAEQLIEKIGEFIKLAELQGEPQPMDGPILVAVDPSLVTYVTDRLEMIHGETTKVISYDANKSEEKMVRIQVRMNDAKHPHTIMIGSKAKVPDSYNLTKLQATFIGVQDNSRENEFTKRVGGRQFHSRKLGGYIYKQRFSDPSFHNSSLVDAFGTHLELPPRGLNQVVPGQYFLGAEKCAAEEPFLDGLKKDILMRWTTGKFFEQYGNLNGGTRPPTSKVQREHSVSKSLIIPLMNPNDKSIDEAYIRNFAQKNNLSSDVDNLIHIVSKSRNSVQSRFSALRKRAKELKMKDTMAIANAAQQVIKQAKKRSVMPPNNPNSDESFVTRRAKKPQAEKDGNAKPKKPIGRDKAVQSEEKTENPEAVYAATPLAKTILNAALEEAKITIAHPAITSNYADIVKSIELALQTPGPTRIQNARLEADTMIIKALVQDTTS